MPDELAKEMAIEATKAVVTEGYKDLLQPTFQSVGNVIALPFQAVEIALEKVRLWVVEKQYGFEKTKEILAQKLKDVPKEKIVPPEKYVAVPALQQISYCFDSDELREMYVSFAKFWRSQQTLEYEELLLLKKSNKPSHNCFGN